MVADPSLPPGYEVVRVLAQRPGVRVVRARRGGREVVVRCESTSDGRPPVEALAELEVLAAVEHPGLARLVDFGPLLPQGRYVAREWVEGVPLSDLASERSASDLGRIVARLAQSIDRLHAAGFVHGDLKADNVVVGAGDEPVLIDFGLAARAGSGGAGGTPVHVPPEVLLGAPFEAAGDLFALGVTLASVLVPFGADARTFHADFPRNPFLEAARIDPARLPSWARDLVVATTDRDPAQRPASAAWIAQTLAARLGGVKRRAPAALRPRWPVLEGREDFVDTRVRGLGVDHACEAWTFGDEVEAARVGRATALRLALAGEGVEGIDLSEVARTSRTPLDLDRWAREAAWSGGLTILWGSRTDWADRALQAWLGAARQLGTRTIVCASVQRRTPADLARVPFPALTEPRVCSRLHAWLPDEDAERLATLAERVHAECAGSTVRAEALVHAVIDEGWIRPTHKGLQLRRGVLPTHLGRSSAGGREERLRGLSDDARVLVGALVIADRTVPLGALSERTGLDGGALAAAAAEALAAGVLLVTDEGWRAARPLPRRRSLDLSLESWSALHRRVAGQSDGESRLRHELAAGVASSAAALRDAAVRLRESGAPERAVDLLLATLGDARAAGDDPPAWVEGELAIAWSAAGNPEQAERLVRSLERKGDAESTAYALRTRARTASSRQRFDEAHALYREAAELDPSVAGEVRLARARIAFEAGDDATLSALAEDSAEIPRPVAENVRALVAMNALRRGRVDEARGMMEASLVAVAKLGERAHEAPLRFNLGVLARRVGDARAAIAHLEGALALHEEVGDPVGIARTQLVLGVARREQGDLIESQALLVECTATRERLGDEIGAERARGALGLSLAERGHARVAADALLASAAGLRAAEAVEDADRFEATATEVLARLGHAGGPLDSSGSPAADVARARAAWSAGNPALASTLAEAACTRALELGQARYEAEARWLRDRLQGAPTVADSGYATLDQDADVLELLGAADLEPRRALALARALAARGRDDRAARVAAAVAARTQDAQARQAAAALASEAFARCAAGATGAERLALRQHLLGVPDPRPEDLRAFEAPDPGEDEMDLLKLLEINQRLVDQEDLPRLLGAIVESALEVTGAERGFLALEEQGVLHLDLAMDSIRGDLDVEEVEVSQTVLAEALASENVLRISNAAADPILGAAPSVAELDLRSILCCPFDVQPGLRGVVYVDHRVREGAFDERAERLLALLAGQAALAIRQVRRLEEILRLNEELGREVATRETDLRAAQRVLTRSGLTVPIDGLVGDSEPMREVNELLRRVAAAELPVLITGESGTGKELAARAVHDLSPRREGPFVSENCAALPATIVESELFGHARGAFTGAEQERAGLFERAGGGTLFLDEVGELPPELQAKLLRVLETREVRRLGSEASMPVDFRLVAATNRDLAAEVDAGRFRSDLMYRLDAVRVDLPPLAERLDDLPALIDHFLRLQAARDGVRRRCSRDVLVALSEREWPGNVRELSNEVARLCVLSEGDLDDPGMVRAPHRSRVTGGRRPILPLAELEKQAILDALERTGGDKRRAAALLGISRAKVYQRVKEWREDELQPSE